jgi:hypothetical protein
VGAAIALLARLARRRLTAAINAPLLGYGYVLTSIVADLLAAILATIAFALPA